MDNKKLDLWASKFLGVNDAEAEADAAIGWFTQSPGSAFVVLDKCANEGCSVTIEISGDSVKVECDKAEAKGSKKDLARLMVEAAYNCHNGINEAGEDDSDGDDA
jgi:hypothetical protein